MLKIVLATDFREASENAFRYVLSLSGQVRVEVFVAHIYKRLPTSDPDREYREFLIRTRHFTSLYPDLIEQEVVMNCSVEAEVSDGNAVEELVKSAQLHGADLIAIGAKRPAGLFKRLFGFLAETLIRRRPFPVLVIPQGYEGEGFNHVGVVCISEQCKEQIARWMKRYSIFSRTEKHTVMMPTYRQQSVDDIQPKPAHSRHHLVPRFSAESIMETTAKTEIDVLILSSEGFSLGEQAVERQILQELYDITSIPLLLV